MEALYTRKGLRYLFIFYLFFSFFIQYIDWVQPSWVFSEDFKKYHELVFSELFTEDSWTLVFIALGMLILSYISIIGMCFFKNWARILYIIVFLLGFLLFPYTSIIMYSGISELLSSLLGTIDVLIVVLLLQKNVIKHFVKEPPNK